MKRLKILHCIRSLDPSGGGPADFVKMVAEFQNTFAIDVEVVTLDSPQSEWISTFPAPIHALGPVNDTYGYSAKLEHWLRANLTRFDIAVANGVWTFTSRAVRAAALECKRPYVLFTHGMLDPWFARYRLKHLKKCIYWKLFEHKVLQDADAVFFTSQHERDRARVAFRPYQAREIVTAYGTVDPGPTLPESNDTFLKGYPDLRDKRFLLFLSRLHEKKGVDLLIQAFCDVARESAELSLVLAGPASEQFLPKLNAALQSVPPDVRNRIIRIEMLRGAEKWGAISACEALVLPSHQENFARVVSEALSCSTPALITNKVNIWNIVQEGQAGLVENDDREGVCSLLRKWLALNGETRSAMRRNARRVYEEHFDATSNFRLYLDNLIEIAQNRSAAARG